MLSVAEEPFLQRLQSGSTVMMKGNFQHEKRLALQGRPIYAAWTPLDFSFYS